MSGFHGAFATGVACQQGTLTLPDTWFHPPFWDLLMLQLLRPNSSNLPCLYSTFHLEYPLVLSRFCFTPYQRLWLYNGAPLVAFYDTLGIRRTQLLFTKTETNERLAAPVSSDDLRRTFLDSVTKKPRENNKWAVNVWRNQAIRRNSQAERYFENPEQFWVHVELRLAEVNKLNYWMARFITEVRRKDGTDYPPNTLTQIMAGLQRDLREEYDRPGINLLKKDDTTFDLFRKSLDARKKELTNCGVGVKVRRADPVLKSDEEKLSSTGVLKIDSSTGLSNCVFFLQL